LKLAGFGPPVFIVQGFSLGFSIFGFLIFGSFIFGFFKTFLSNLLVRYLTHLPRIPTSVEQLALS